MKNKSSMTIKALIFDVDGTLANTERDGHRMAFNKAFEECGLDWHWDVALYGKLLAVTGGKERIRYYVEKFFPKSEWPINLDQLIITCHKAKTSHYTAMLADGKIPMRPGVKRLINEARRSGLRLAIATTTTPENVTALLRHSLAEDALSWFEVIAAGDIVPAKKPSPDIYLWTLQQLGLMPAQCVAFEDSYNGLMSSLSAGINNTIVTVNDYTSQDDFSDAKIVLSDLGEPDAPFSMLSGSTDGKSYLDLSLLQHWFG